MKNKPKISCIILTCDSHIDKGESIFHCMASVLMQNFEDFEIILVENSHTKTQNIQRLLQFCKNQNSHRAIPVGLKIINNSKSLSWGAARNKGIQLAKGEYLVFLDDDTIMVNVNTFAEIALASTQYDYGYGAVRLWTNGNWFQAHSQEVLEEIIIGDFKNLIAHSGKPERGIRGQDDIHMQTKTFIGNLGFCKKSILERIGGFPDFKGYGFEDDYVMFRLYEGGYRLKLLENIRVVHVNHRIQNSKVRNLIPYFQDLVRRNYYWFHVAKIFEKNSVPRSEVLEPLKSLHYDYRVEEAYLQYQLSVPLDIDKNEIRKIKIWKDKNQFTKQAFSRVIFKLQHSYNLDTFIQTSGADFDNLAAVIKAAMNYGFVSIDRKTNSIQKIFNFHFTQPYEQERATIPTIVPKKQFNQFPCDHQSRLRRVKFLKERYPFAEYLRFGIIGDDDLLSLEFKNEYWAWPIVIEKDKTLVKAIREHDPRVQILQEDVRSFKNKNNIIVQTFIADPPYTLYGVLSFIYAGLLMLPEDWEEREFYVIINEAMIGKSLLTIQQVLAKADIYLSEIKENFSQYKMPKNFKERKRANFFLKNIKLRADSVAYSSSSHLYIFKTNNPKHEIIRAFIQPDLIYEHY